ncbi:POTASSIUM CHANNEL AKT1 [Salix koriyanagi]|uniref:POTASSIUM CHANNEL AKT1 n=1 Tax=Salix koriyanagi TaxID=2511006 RepID=A0A9Q0VDQ6_9ROSI|nr:POTASSIUM CHANNEL AKT1 [Salix koriyanagi]
MGSYIFYMLFNLGLTAYLIGNMTSLVVPGTSRTRRFRDTIQAASSFAQRNKLPDRLQDQMLAHLCLKFRTDSEGLQQEETLDSLPRGIRSSISHYLFYSLVDKVYLFRGVSNDLLFQLVSEMKAECYPPKEDVILQNEAPTDYYILVTGAVDLLAMNNGVEQAVREAETGDLCGEIGSTGNVGDGTIIMNNLLQEHCWRRRRCLQALLEKGAKIFDISLAKVMSGDGAEIDDIEVNRDGDHLILATDAMQGPDKKHS